jgi:CelD/BcsL family acetyltransferase involved in cellulose biosynthesis
MMDGGLQALAPEEIGKSPSAQGWSAALRRAALYDIGHTPQWAHAWWRSYGEAGAVQKSSWILVDRPDGVVHGVWPFMIRRRYGMRIVHWVGQVDGMITDYLGAALPPPDGGPGTRRCLEHLAASTSLWDVVDLRVPAWSGQLSWFAREAALVGPRLGLAWEVRIADHAVAVDLSSGVEGYMATLGKRTREDVARVLRAPDKEGLVLTVHEGVAVAGSLASLFELNSARWTVFHRCGDRAFMEAAVADLVAAREPVFLAELSERGRVAAAVLGFQACGRYFLHPAGVSREKLGGLGPGVTLYVLLIRWLVSRGVPALDLSPGLESYKLRLGNRVEPLYQFLLWHRGSRITRWRAFDYLRRQKQLRRANMGDQQGRGEVAS